MKMHKLILVEGISGVGKTSYCNTLQKTLSNSGLNAVYYPENSFHPTNLNRTALLTKKEYENLLIEIKRMYECKKTFGEIILILNRLVVCEEKNILIPYSSLLNDNHFDPIISIFKKKDICNGQSSFSKYQQCHYVRWKRFAESNDNLDTIHIFDGALLQAALFDLLGFYCMDSEQILNYINEILTSVKNLDPIIYYIDTNNVSSVVNDAIGSRVNTRWREGFHMWLKHSTYCMSHGYQEDSGIVAFLKDRQQKEREILKKVIVPVEIVWR